MFHRECKHRFSLASCAAVCHTCVFRAFLPRGDASPTSCFSSFLHWVLLFRHHVAWCGEMTIILRLEGLDAKAGTEDIRTFFAGLHIPDGGVYIVGGSLSEAFIAFTVYRDAQLAMRYTEKFLKGSKVTLHISSMAELEQRLNPPLTTDANVPGYVRLFGLPGATTKDDICQFFKGLTVQEAIVNVELGRSHVCLAKFANAQDACNALLFNQHSLGPICVEVRGATEKMWTSAMQECQSALEVGGATPKQSPPVTRRPETTSAPELKRRAVDQLPSKSPKKPKSTPTMEYVVMVTNLPEIMTKTEIKELFGCPNIAHKNVQHLLDKEGNRTDIAFLIFNRTEDYEYAINLNGCHVSSNAIQVSSIGKKTMWEMVAKTRPRKQNNTGSKNEPNGTCLLVRNMPADVKKRHIQRLFGDYKVREENIISLRDRDGNSIGEAVVQFQSQKFAALAQKLHGQNFLGTKVLLTLINGTQVENILTRSVSGS
uniref:RNA binding motif protein 12Ba n=1 Tax=Gasterosteus aculeatus aculeatus TaxID=481459 RepID=A0AAQ4RDK4_GASAC